MSIKKRHLQLISDIIARADELIRINIGEDTHDEDIYESLKQLHDNESLYFLLQMGPYNKRVQSEENIKMMEVLEKMYHDLEKEGKIKKP